MHGKELNRATTEVASSIDISGQAAADEIKRGLQTEEKRSFWRIVSSAIPGYLMALGLFSGANIHIVSGSGSTDDNRNRTGLGNLIIGYDEAPGSQPLTGFPLNPGDRGGSHNLVIGRFNRFTQAAFGGLVAGEVNTISNVSASVTGGDQNAATGAHSTVTGGEANTASGQWASVSGGDFSTASGYGASVSGGLLNISSAAETSVLGGAANNAIFSNPS
jgi:hypothetical protein